MTLLNDIAVWTTACEYDRLIPGRGVGVLLDDGSQAALFRLDDGSVHAVGNVDPFSGAAVLSRVPTPPWSIAGRYFHPNIDTLQIRRTATREVVSGSGTWDTQDGTVAWESFAVELIGKAAQ